MTAPSSRGTDAHWHQLFDDAYDELHGFFQNKDADEVRLRRVKVASSVLSSYTRHEQTESAKEATRVLVARHLTDNKESLEAYLKGVAPTLLLGAGKE